MKKIFVLFVTILTVLAYFSPCLLNENQTNKVSAEPSLKPIDIYLIGGQSNAAGYSAKGGLSETFENIGYAGEIDRSVDGSVKQSLISNFNDYVWGVTSGLGRTSNHIGPEYGMAKELNGVYTGQTKAFIIKTATGSTPLRNIDRPNGSYDPWGGNWYPRSQWEEGYIPNVQTLTPRTGVLYQRFIDNFKTVYNNLVSQGYQPIVRGMAWMQGEDDLGYHNEYKVLLKAFISDIRADITKITGDQKDMQMPFVIGKIATTFGSYNNSKVPAFNAVQQEVANEMEKVETIETSDLIINDATGVKGTDAYHFSGADSLKLGRRFAQKILEMGDKKSVSFTGNNANCSYIEKADGSIELNIKPNSGYVVTKVEINGVDVTVEVANGKYLIANPEQITKVVVETRDLSVCEITYENFENGSFLYWYEHTEKKVGETLQVKVRVNEGYVIDGVYCNGEAMRYNKDKGVYEIVVKENSVITVSVKPQVDDSVDSSSSDKNSDANNSSCKSNIFTPNMLIYFSIIAFLIMILQKRKTVNR